MLQVKTFHFFPHCLRDNLICQREGKEDMGAWKARQAREEGGRETRFSFPFSLAGGLATKFPSLPFRTPATHARDNQVIVLSYSSFQIIVINFTRCDFHPQNSYPILIMVLPQSVYLQTGNRALIKHLIDRRSVTSNYHGSKISE